MWPWASIGSLSQIQPAAPSVSDRRLDLLQSMRQTAN